MVKVTLSQRPPNYVRKPIQQWKVASSLICSVISRTEKTMLKIFTNRQRTVISMHGSQSRPSRCIWSASNVKMTMASLQTTTRKPPSAWSSTIHNATFSLSKRLSDFTRCRDACHKHVACAKTVLINLRRTIIMSRRENSMNKPQICTKSTTSWATLIKCSLNGQTLRYWLRSFRRSRR